MKDELRRARDALCRFADREELARCIDRCALDETDVEILRRVHLKHQSQVQIAFDLHISVETVGRRYRRALGVLSRVAARMTES